MAPPLHPPAWYPDPGDPDRIRRWNGRAWTDDVRPLPTWLRTLRLSPGPPARVPRGSRWLWIVSALLLGAGALVMVLLGRGLGDDPDVLGDRTFAGAADARCEGELQDGASADAVARLVGHLRALPVDRRDAPAVERWLTAWDEWAGDDVARDSLARVRLLRFADVNHLPHCAV